MYSIVVLGTKLKLAISTHKSWHGRDFYNFKKGLTNTQLYIYMRDSMNMREYESQYDRLPRHFVEFATN